jgi:hypothetical protein
MLHGLARKRRSPQRSTGPTDHPSCGDFAKKLVHFVFCYKSVSQPLRSEACANAALADAQAKNADLTAKSIDVADIARADLLSRVQAQAAAANQAAQQQYDTDSQRDLNDPVILQQNPPPPQSWLQTVIDFFPSWKTVGVVTLGTAAFLIPGAGPVLFAVGVGLLAASTAYSAYDRYFNQGQSGLQALLGGAADATGISGIYTGITGRDLVTQHHLSLTEAQQRQMLTEGSLQAVGSGLLLYGGVRSFLRGRALAAPTRGEPQSQFLLTARPNLTQQALDHIILRHWATSGATNAGKFSADITARSLRAIITEAAARGRWTADRFGRSRIEFDFGKQIGVNMNGQPATRLRLIVEPNLDVVTAFPF